MTSNVYGFKDVTAGLVGPGGLISIGSDAGVSDEGITVTPSIEFNTMQVGVDGYGQHSLSADRSGTVTVRLLRTSPVNAQLMTMANFQRASAANHGQNTITITDKNRGDVMTCEQVAFKRIPDITLAKEAGMLEWVFDAIRVTPILGF